MKQRNFAFASAELLLVCPAILFFTSLLLRSLQPTQYEPAHTAQAVVDWYSAQAASGAMGSAHGDAIDSACHWVSGAPPRMAQSARIAGGLAPNMFRHIESLANGSDCDSHALSGRLSAHCRLALFSWLNV
jgi:hypothetical protein